MARIAITGAGGSVGSGMVPRLTAAGHEVIASDVVDVSYGPGVRSVVADVRTGDGLDEAVRGADLLLHLPAWHGIHLGQRSDADFWEVNVDGTFRSLDAAQRAGIGRVVWLSSQAIHDRHDRYGFTKVLGEQLLEHQRVRERISYVSVRPGNFTPWTDWAGDFGRGLLYDRVTRADVLDAIHLAVDYTLANDDALVLDAVHRPAIPDEIISQWQLDPIAAAEEAIPGAATAIRRFDLNVQEVPALERTSGWREVGFSPRNGFAEWVAAALSMTDEEAATRKVELP